MLNPEATVTELKPEAIQLLTEYMTVHFKNIGPVHITDTEILFLHKIMF